MKLSVQEHQDRANMRRPRGRIVLWIGKVEPIRARDGDLWLDTSRADVKRKAD